MLYISERRDHLPQGWKQKPAVFCCHFIVFSMRNLKISPADGEREEKKTQNKCTQTHNVSGFFSVQIHGEIKTGILGFGCGMILTMQLPKPAAPLIKATGTSSSVYPAAFNHPQYNNFPLSDPIPISHATCSPETDFTYLGMEAVSLVMLLLCSAWCRAPVSEKKTPCFKIYDHVQNTHICLSWEQCPGAGTALTLLFVPNLTLPKVPDALRQDRKDQEGLRTWSSGK